MDALPQLVVTLTFATTGLAIVALPAELQTMFMPPAPRSIRTFGAPALAFSRIPVSRQQGSARMGYQYAWIADNRDPADARHRACFRKGA